MLATMELSGNTLRSHNKTDLFSRFYSQSAKIKGQNDDERRRKERGVSVFATYHTIILAAQIPAIAQFLPLSPSHFDSTASSISVSCLIANGATNN